MLAASYVSAQANKWLLLRCLIALPLLAAGCLKGLHLDRFAVDIASLGIIPPGLSDSAAILVVGAEIVLGISVLLARCSLIPAQGVVLMASAFIGVNLLTASRERVVVSAPRSV